MPGWMSTLMSIRNFMFSIRGVVALSFIAHVVLVLLAGVRRRQATGGATLLLWLANQIARWAPTAALGIITNYSTVAHGRLQATLWAAFMLLHAAMPDNITAYALEDSVLSLRQRVDVIVQVFGPVSPAYILYLNTVAMPGDSMLWVSSFVCLMAIAKYMEGAYYALQRGNLENMRSSRKKEEKKKVMISRSLQNASRGGRKPDDEQILLIAHDMLYITKNAFMDFLDKKSDDDDEQEALSGTWDETLYKVVSMELSLMYDILYTKKVMVQTWGGYAIRFASPFLGATAFLLFWFHSKQGQATADVVITYVLLGGAVILDIKWLLRAVVSTWTYSYLNDRPRSWLHHALLCSGKWRMLRRFILSLNLFRFLVNSNNPTRYRMWSGTIGQYNLLRQCTRQEDEKTSNFWSSQWKKNAPEDTWMEYEYHNSRGIQISRDFRNKLFDRVWKNMELAFPERIPVEYPLPPHPYPMALMEFDLSLPAPPPKPITGFDQELNDALDFTPDLQETILVLHIATDIFLSHTESGPNQDQSEWGKSIKALSDYMMFLVAVRPTMLPGLALSSRYEALLDALGEQWNEIKSSSSFNNSMTREKCLAKSLLDKEMKKNGRTPMRTFKWYQGNKTEILSPGAYLSVLYDSSYILSDGARLADLLLKWKPGSKIEIGDKVLEDKLKRQFPDLMKSGEVTETELEYQMPKEVTDIIFREWVRLLINVSIRCTRNSHAKQLARGGELTTVVWILVEHARILRVKKTTKRKPADSYDGLGIHVSRY
uniref:DUF4220 domain-containing protein n=1 Tax=Oryza nivara TaxID=4536 RepID=A0A0E0GXI1_ORYNI|nr:hypothetical protein [Oryza sativa f. spontanea]